MTTSVYSIDCPADDLISWCKILSDIGMLISQHGCKAEQDDGGTLAPFAESLGDVISHYANGIEQLVNRSYLAIQDHLESEKKADEAARRPDQEAIAGIIQKMDIMNRRLGNLEWWKMQKEEVPVDRPGQARA
jgi:hypothetical protein